jgi:hypothetical protein
MRGRRFTAFLAAGLLALAAGCGGGDEVAPEVPGPPADVVIPESADAPTGEGSNQDEQSTDETDQDTDTDTDTDSGAGATDDSGGTATPEETAPPADQGGAATPDASGGGTAAPETETDGPTNDTPPPEGSNAEQFEDFCAQNPGAC